MAVDIIHADDEYGDYCLIPLIKKKLVVGYALVDPENFQWLNSFNWTIDNGGYVLATISSSKYGTSRMHRWILMEAGYNLTNLLVDHRNRVTYDNRKLNLRPATPLQNSRNRSLSKNAKIDYKGVTTNFSGNYKVCIGYKEKSYHLGTYSCKTKAAEAYDIAALVLDSEFFYLNFPDKDYSGTTLEKHQSLYCRRQTSEYRSVCYVDAGWRAQVTHDGKRYSSRSYLTQEKPTTCELNYMEKRLYDH